MLRERDSSVVDKDPRENNPLSLLDKASKEVEEEEEEKEEEEEEKKKEEEEKFALENSNRDKRRDSLKVIVKRL